MSKPENLSASSNRHSRIIPGNEIAQNATRGPQEEVLLTNSLYGILIWRQQGSQKIGTISSKLPRKFWHLTGLVSAMASLLSGETP